MKLLRRILASKVNLWREGTVIKHDNKRRKAELKARREAMK